MSLEGAGEDRGLEPLAPQLGPVALAPVPVAVIEPPVTGQELQRPVSVSFSARKSRISLTVPRRSLLIRSPRFSEDQGGGITGQGMPRAISWW